MPVPELGAAHEAPASGDSLVDNVVEALRIDVRLRATGHWPVWTSPCFASARAGSGRDAVQGFGSGATPEQARLRSVMECAERYAQFGRIDPPVAATGSRDDLGEDALSPVECGLYTDRQYATAGFGLARFSERAALEWSAVEDLGTGVRRLLPVEFFHPRAALNRERLVVESSSGTAAHTRPDAATRAALSEAIERDALMLFWYRRPPTRAVPVDAVPDPQIREDLRRIQRSGFVVTIGSLTYDVGVPCFIVFGIRGDAFIYGAGCDPDWHRALQHALTELSQSIRQLLETPPVTTIGRSLVDVRTPADHYGLYNRGPWHPVLRQTLARTLIPAGTLNEWNRDPDAMSDADAVRGLVGALASRQWHAYRCDITPPELESLGVCVKRVIVPGLIPVHFGYNRMRLGCRRLWDAGAPGRLATLLPHFFG